MTRALLLARRYLWFHRGRTALLMACVALTAVLPITVEWLVDTWGRSMRSRADATPLLVGAKGSRFDLALNTLYFRGRVPEHIPMRELRRLADSGLCEPVPILARDTAKGWPLVGTSSDYYPRRGLRAAEGTLPAVLGECVIGSEVAATEQLQSGDRLLTDRGSLYRIDSPYPLRMRVVGVLERSGTADDRAVFASLATVWIAEGIGHGHDEASQQAESAVLRRNGEEIVLDSSVQEFQEITEANIDSFHFHAEEDELPITAVIAWPESSKARTILKGRYRAAEDSQMLEPRVVIDEITAFVFQLKAFFDANVALVLITTAMFLGLVVTLSIRVRKREIDTLIRIGCSRLTVARILGTEFGLVILGGLTLGTGLAALLVTGLQAWVLP